MPLRRRDRALATSRAVALEAADSEPWNRTTQGECQWQTKAGPIVPLAKRRYQEVLSLIIPNQEICSCPV